MRPTAADVPSRAPAGAARSERPTVPHRSVEGGPRWLIQVEGGEFQLVESERELAELARLGRVTGTTPVYTVADGPRALEEVPALAGFLGGPVSSEPPIRLVQRSPEREMLSEELAILDRPLDDDVEYYDELPSRRWPRRLAFALALAAGVLGAYLFVLPRFPSWRTSVTTRLILPVRSWVGGSGPAHAIPASPAVPAVSARAESTAVVAAPAPAPIPAAPTVPAPDTTGDPSGGAPIADGEARATRGPRAQRSPRRHRSGNHGPTGR